MASPNRLGVPKREPCFKCGNPVFLAERLLVEKQLFHRSCLRCARCNTQLTLGSFYETEKDGEYCCETCPDEEVHLVQKQAQNKTSKFQDRISFFENRDPNKIIKHSLSDEEKTKNMEAQKSSQTFVHMTNFLNKSLVQDDENDDDDDEADEEDDDSDNDENDAQILRVKNEEIKIKDDVTKDNTASDIRLSDLLESHNLDNVDLEFSSIEVPEGDNDESAFNNLLGNLDDTVKIIPLKIEDEKPPIDVPISDEEKIETKIVENHEKTPIEEIVEKNSKPIEINVSLTDGKNIIENEAENYKLVKDIKLTEIDFSQVENEIEPVKRTENHEIVDIENVELIEKTFENKNKVTAVELIENHVEIDKEQVEIYKEQVEMNIEPVEMNIEPVKMNVEPVEMNIEPIEMNIEPIEMNIEPVEMSTEPVEKLQVSNDSMESKENTADPTENGAELAKTTIVSVKPLKSDKELLDNEVEAIKTQSKINEIAEKVDNMHIETKNSKDKDYPEDLNPFGDDDEEEAVKQVPQKRVSTNPFGSDDEDEYSTFQSPSKVKPPRPPPPKLRSTNPFGSDDEEEEDIKAVERPVASPRRTPVPTPRKNVNCNDSISSQDISFSSNRFGGSVTSLTSSLGSANNSVARRKKGMAPPIPSFDKNSSLSKSNNSLSSDLNKTPKKKRPAPVPPPASTPITVPEIHDTTEISAISITPPILSNTQRLISVDPSLLNDDLPSESLSRVNSSESVVYRRTIVPLDTGDDEDLNSESERQWEKMKDNKEAQNRNRQSQQSIEFNNSVLSNKSNQGKWKRRKGPAPSLPVPAPQKKILKMLPLQEIRQELEIIEIQQQGLEKQGVILEKMIRERCEGDASKDISDIQTNSKEVEDLIMQLFELVNEKNELFRRQAELMYIRRQHRLEQEQADLEYEIRVLMAQPEKNKTDSDKAKEEALIARLVEIVQMRNEVVDCLEMDRLREAEEDLSIKHSIEERTAKREKEQSNTNQSPAKLSKKEKKKLKEAKKLAKNKRIDAEKDADESETPSKPVKEKKKKRKFLF